MSGARAGTLPPGAVGAAAAPGLRSVSTVFVSPSDMQNAMANRAVPPNAAASPAGASGACPACKTPITSGTRFCSQCGTKLDPNAPAPPGAKAAAAIKQTQFMQAFQVKEALKNKNRLVVMDAEGRETMQYSIQAAQTLCGRVHGMLILDDAFVSPAHCAFRFMDDVLSVEDSGSVNGVFLKVRGDVALGPGDAFRVGRHLIRVESPEALALDAPPRGDDDDSNVAGTPASKPATLRFVEVLEGGAVGDSRLLRGSSMTFGRAGCDFVLEDASVSARHCEVSVQAGLPLLKDSGSTNGTFIRLREEQRLDNGDVLLMGQTRLRVDVRP